MLNRKFDGNAVIHLPAPRGTFSDVGLDLSLASVFSSSLWLETTVMWLWIDLALTTFWVAVVSVQELPVVWLLRNSRMEGDLSIRLRVCNKIGPSLEIFLFIRCWNMIDPSGMLVAPPAVVNVDVANVLDADAFFNPCVDCSTDAVLFNPLPFNTDVSAIWLFVMVVAVFKDDWIINLFDSVDNFGAVDATLVNFAFLCSRIEGAFDVWHVRLSSSLLAILTVPLFNKLSKSCPFCRIIWPFSVRAPRIKMMLLGWCDCCCWKKTTTTKQINLHECAITSNNWFLYMQLKSKCTWIRLSACEMKCHKNLKDFKHTKHIK